MLNNLMLNASEFRKMFFELTENWSWEVEGFIDKNNQVHPIDNDTKVISTVFERLCSPVIRTIAKNYGYVVETANQTTYPDFTLTNTDIDHRIAIDIKTTYEQQRMRFTLGGYNSFLRNNKKNILYPYNTYDDHWIIGFVYKQNPPFEEYDMDGIPLRGQIECPYSVKAVIVREKHAITGLRAGSGNTKNIGSVDVAYPEEFHDVQGPFTYFRYGKQACDHFWRNYETYVQQGIASLMDLRGHPDFERFE